MGPRGRRLALGALAWTGAVVLTGTVAWNAVAVISDDGARPGVLAPHQVTAALAEARASATSTPSAGPTPDPSTSPTNPASPSTAPGTDPSTAPGPTPTTPVDPGGTPSAGPSTPAPPEPSPTQATWVVTGGSVTAQCTGASIRLVAATPDDGWTVEVGSPGPERVEVELHRSGSETKVRAACSGGAPVQLADGERSDHDSDHD